MQKMLLIPAMFFSAPAIADDTEIQCLANAIYYEASGEADKGKIAVGNVVLNRTKSGKYPKSVCKVISQRGQFSWFPRSNTANQKSLKIARDIFQGNIQDMTMGALFFHSTSIGKPRGWRAKLTMSIGRHRFYR